MPIIVNIPTQNDGDFVRAFVLSTRVDAWDATFFYSAATQAAYAGRIWSAVADNVNVTPGTDPTKWSLSSAPKRDLTGCTLKFTARAGASSKVVSLLASTGADGNIVVTDAVGGAFTLTLPFAQLKTMPGGQYAHDLVLILPSGERDIIWAGTLTHTVGAGHD